MTRQRLPDRRPSFTTQLVYEGNVYSATLGFDVTNERIAEVFTHGAKVGLGYGPHPRRCLRRALAFAPAWRRARSTCG